MVLLFLLLLIGTLVVILVEYWAQKVSCVFRHESWITSLLSHVEYNLFERRRIMTSRKEMMRGWYEEEVVPEMLSMVQLWCCLVAWIFFSGTISSPSWNTFQLPSSLQCVAISNSMRHFALASATSPAVPTFHHAGIYTSRHPSSLVEHMLDAFSICPCDGQKEYHRFHDLPGTGILVWIGESRRKGAAGRGKRIERGVSLHGDERYRRKAKEDKEMKFNWRLRIDWRPGHFPDDKKIL